MKKFLTWLTNAFLTIGRGDILLKLGVHRYLPHIIFAFAVCAISIVLSYYADSTLIVREKRMKELESAKIVYSSKYREMVSLYRYTTVEDMLEKAGSDLKPLREPAIELKEK